MNNALRLLGIILLVIALQVWVLTPISLFRVATPIVYPTLLLFMSTKRGAIGFMIGGFLLGSAIDYLSLTPGLNAASFTFSSFIYSYIIKGLIEPEDRSRGLIPYLAIRSKAFPLLAVILLVHHLIIYSLSAVMHTDWLFAVLRMIAGYILSYILSALLLLGFSPHFSKK